MDKIDKNDGKIKKIIEELSEYSKEENHSVLTLIAEGQDAGIFFKGDVFAMIMGAYHSSEDFRALMNAAVIEILETVSKSEILGELASHNLQNKVKS